MVYAVFHCGNIERDIVYENNQFIEAVKSDLKDDDALNVVLQGQFIITLNSTTELGAMQISRLVRSAFQRITVVSHSK